MQSDKIGACGNLKTMGQVDASIVGISAVEIKICVFLSAILLPVMHENRERLMSTLTQGQRESWKLCRISKPFLGVSSAKLISRMKLTNWILKLTKPLAFLTSLQRIDIAHPGIRGGSLPALESNGRSL